MLKDVTGDLKLIATKQLSVLKDIRTSRSSMSGEKLQEYQQKSERAHVLLGQLSGLLDDYTSIILKSGGIVDEPDLKIIRTKYKTLRNNLISCYE
jgi:hypothetical protein